MLGFLFGFNARLGRLHFVMANLALLMVGVIAYLIVAAVVLKHLPANLALNDVEAFVTTGWRAGAIQAVVWGAALAGFMVCAMRVRDVGWDPVLVGPVWIAVQLIDRVVAMRFPAWSAAEGQTVVGVLLEGIFVLFLFICPSGAFGGPSQGSGPAPKRNPLNDAASDRLRRASQGGRMQTWT